MRLPTPRLVLRTAAPADVPALVAYALGEARESARFSPRRPPSHFTAAHWRRRVRAQEEARRADRGLVLYLFRRGAPREVVGHASLSNVVRGTFQAAHLGYALREAHRGEGLMTEALRAVLRHAFGPMRLHRVMANYVPSNAPSARVLRRLGFRREGLARDYLLIDGRWRDHVLTSLVHPRWRPDPRDPAAAAAAGGRR